VTCFGDPDICRVRRPKEDHLMISLTVFAVFP
jgi:hypothetical protein